mmetsp:Transcript_2658/g.3987  ORF Transcript_2658/g.3987 Transcript_2658/m.3987 type:complete len:351 (+) Transcript_2658:65-1117(+)
MQSVRILQLYPAWEIHALLRINEEMYSAENIGFHFAQGYPLPLSLSGTSRGVTVCSGPGSITACCRGATTFESKNWLSWITINVIEPSDIIVYQKRNNGNSGGEATASSMLSVWGTRFATSAYNWLKVHFLHSRSLHTYSSVDSLTTQMDSAYAHIVRSLDVQGSGQPYLCGEKPGPADALLFGHLVRALTADELSPLRSLLEASHPKLLDYFHSICHTYFRQLRSVWQQADFTLRHCNPVAATHSMWFRTGKTTVTRKEIDLVYGSESAICMDDAVVHRAGSLPGVLNSGCQPVEARCPVFIQSMISCLLRNSSRISENDNVVDVGYGGITFSAVVVGCFMCSFVKLVA